MLVGRQPELAELEATLHRVERSGGSLALLAGEAGIGKTRLASELADRARALGMITAWGRCWEGRGAPVFWPWIEAFEALGISFPSASAVTDSDPERARFALFRAAASALGQVAAKQPVLIVLEDLHAADRSTLLLLELIAAQLANLATLVLGTYRNPEARLGAETGDAIARIGRLGRVFSIPRLSPASVAQLVRHTIADAGDQLGASIYEITHGNPLFVTEIVRDIRAHGTRGQLPLGVREVIRERLALISAETRSVLEAGAVLGVEFEPGDVECMRPGARGHLDTALASDLLVVREGRLRFSHALYREALYHDLPREQRQALHRQAADALAERAPPSARAHHLLEGGASVVAEAVDQAIAAAAQSCDQFAFEDALALLERARSALSPGADMAALRCRLLIAHGEAKLRSGDVAGRQTCVQAADLARSLADPELLALSGLAYGAVFTMGGVDPVLVAMLEQALAGLPAADSPLRARTMARLAAARQPSPPHERAPDIQLALDAIAMARRAAGSRDRLRVLQAASGALYGAVHPAIRLPVSLEQEQLAEELGDVARLLQARVRLALDYMELGDFASYAGLADKYEQIATRIGAAAQPWRVPLMRSMIAIAGDRFDESQRWQAEAHKRQGEDARARRAIAFHRIGFLRAAERHAELRAAIDEMRGLWLSMPYGRMLADARVASCLARVGDDDQVRTVVAQLPEAAIVEEINTTPLADALWSTADRGLAERLRPVMEQTGDRWVCYWLDTEIAEPPNARSLALAAAVLGRWGECEQQLQYALALCERTGRRGLAARMRFEMGDLWLRREHAVERARSLVTDARREAQALGLVELVALIDRRHPALRDAPSPGPQLGPAFEFAMSREGEYYAIVGSGGQTLRFKASRGMQYLAQLVERAEIEIHVLELAGSADHADWSGAGELIDQTALSAYKAHLEQLRDAAETAEQLGDLDRAQAARLEMEAIAAELGRSTRGGRRPRRGSSAVDRARSAVQRRIKDALSRIGEQDEALGAWLNRCVRTGNYCRFSRSQ